MKKSDSKKYEWEKVLDEFNPHWEKLKTIMEKHPKGTFKFMEHDSAEHGWLIEIDIDLLGLPKETTKSSLYKE